MPGLVGLTQSWHPNAVVAKLTHLAAGHDQLPSDDADMQMALARGFVAQSDGSWSITDQGREMVARVTGGAA